MDSFSTATSAGVAGSLRADRISIEDGNAGEASAVVLRIAVSNPGDNPVVLRRISAYLGDELCFLSSQQDGPYVYRFRINSIEMSATADGYVGQIIFTDDTESSFVGEVRFRVGERCNPSMIFQLPVVVPIDARSATSIDINFPSKAVALVTQEDRPDVAESTTSEPVSITPGVALQELRDLGYAVVVTLDDDREVTVNCWSSSRLLDPACA